MSDEYEEFLRAKLEKERVEKEAKAVKDMRERIWEYEEKVRKLNEEDAEKKEEKKRKDLEAIQKKKDDALKKIEAMELTDRENYEKRIAEKLKTSEEEKARITEEYEQITAHHSRELEKDRLALEKDLIGTDSARFNIRQDFNDTRIKMMEETEAKLEQKSEEQKKRKEARDTQELTEMVNIMESKIENEWALAKKIEEDGDKRIAMRRDLGNDNLRMQIGLFHLQVHRNNQDNEKRLNLFIQQSQTHMASVVESFQACQQYIGDGLTDKQMERGKKCFADLNRELRSLNEKFLDIERKLTDVEKNEETNDKVDKMKEMKMVIFKLSSCAASLSGQLRVGNTTRNEEKEKEFVALMTELMEKMIQLGKFEKCNSHVMNHLKKATLYVEQDESDEQK